MLSDEQYLALLQKHFGFSAFREGQLESIKALLHDKSLLCIHPTGFGKSLLYQLPSLVLDGLTVVISPLLALMRDQLEHLNHRFQIPAAAINSDQEESANNLARQLASSGQLKVLFIAPEQLDHLDRFQYLLHLPISLVVVDEAHCISTWGHDFRPSYRQIVHYVQALHAINPELRLLGLTATANCKTEEDIKRQLSTLRPITVFRASMDRANISLSSLNCASMAEKLAICHQLVKQLPGCGLIYCATRENTSLVAEYLRSQGIRAAGYHAGLFPEEKRRLQQEFLSDQHQVITATNALGMGIDKPNLRYVIHFDIPGSITAYYQEVGRAGRDGKQAHGILLYHAPDSKVQEHFIHTAQPTQKDFQDIIAILENAAQPPNLTQIKMITGKHPTAVIVILAELIEQGFVEKKSQGGVQVYVRKVKQVLPDLQRYARQLETRRGELAAMVRYALESSACRMEILRKALGDHTAVPCGRCSTCRTSDYLIERQAETVSQTSKWLQQRIVILQEAKLVKLSEGIALLDGQHRLPPFVSFMQKRASTSAEEMGLSEELRELLLSQARQLAKKVPIHAIVPIPSRTWGARDAIASLVANYLGVPVLFDTLQWRQLPTARQGELKNNEQRKHNVDNRMSCAPSPAMKVPGLLLLDDYIGSGATMKEASRALRKEGCYRGLLVPLVMAQVKWRLGTAGMV